MLIIIIKDCLKTNLGYQLKKIIGKKEFYKNSAIFIIQ